MLRAAAEQGRQSARTNAARILREILAQGPRPVTEIRELTKDVASWRTVERAKADLHIEDKAIRDEKGKIIGWEWVLPTERET